MCRAATEPGPSLYHVAARIVQNLFGRTDGLLPMQLVVLPIENAFLPMVRRVEGQPIGLPFDRHQAEFRRFRLCCEMLML